MVTRAAIRALAAGAALLCGCLSFEDDPRLVDRLRVLSIRAEPPEGPPGTAVHFRALAADPSGVEPQLRWVSCDAARASAQAPGLRGDCLKDGHPLALGEGPTMDFTVPAGWFEGVELKDQIVGSGLRFYLVATVGEQRVEAYKSFRVSLNPYSNHNPEIAEASAGGAPALGATVFAAPGADLALQAVAAEGSEEHVSTTLPDGTPVDLSEKLEWEWFADAGSFRGGAIGLRAGRDLGVGLDAVWTAPREATRARIWVVARDRRGGNAFETLSVEVR
jgi:hypothetical protein